MREILFRGRRRDNREWVFGCYYKQTECYGDDTENHIIIASSEDLSYDQVLDYYYVDPETVGQFTGLTDKNGKKIFEGDIVKSEFTKMPYTVCFGEYSYEDEYGNEQSVCGWYNEDQGGYVTGFGCPDDWAIVIGNIHDNPDLFKERDKE